MLHLHNIWLAVSLEGDSNKANFLNYVIYDCFSPSHQEWVQDVYTGLPEWGWLRIQDPPLPFLCGHEGRV